MLTIHYNDTQNLNYSCHQWMPSPGLKDVLTFLYFREGGCTAFGDRIFCFLFTSAPVWAQRLLGSRPNPCETFPDSRAAVVSGWYSTAERAAQTSSNSNPRKIKSCASGTLKKTLQALDDCTTGTTQPHHMTLHMLQVTSLFPTPTWPPMWMTTSLMP